MLKKFLKFIGLAGKTAKSTIDKSTEFIDDTLEAEYITGTLDKAKEASGKLAEKAGEYYAKGKMQAEEWMEDERIKQFKQKASELGKDIEDTAHDIIEKSKEIGRKSMENEKVKKAVEKVKDIGEDVLDTAEDLADRTERLITGEQNPSDEEE